MANAKNLPGFLLTLLPFCRSAPAHVDIHDPLVATEELHYTEKDRRVPSGSSLLKAMVWGLSRTSRGAYGRYGWETR